MKRTFTTIKFIELKTLYRLLSLTVMLLLFTSVGLANTNFDASHVIFGVLSQDSNNDYGKQGQYGMNIHVLATDYYGIHDELDDIILYYLDPVSNEWINFFHGDCDNDDTWQCFSKIDSSVAFDASWTGYWHTDTSTDFLYGKLRFYPPANTFNGYILFKAEVDWDIDSDQTNAGIDDIFYYTYKDDNIGTLDWENYSSFSYDADVSYNEMKFNFLLTEMYGADKSELSDDVVELYRHELDDIFVQYKDASGNWQDIVHGDCDNTWTDISFQVFSQTASGTVIHSEYNDGSRYFTEVKWQMPDSVLGRNIEFRYQYMWDEWKNSTNIDPYGYEYFTVQTYTDRYKPVCTSFETDFCAEKPQVSYSWSITDAHSVDYFVLYRHDNLTINDNADYNKVAEIDNFDREATNFSWINSAFIENDSSIDNAFLLEDGKQYTYWVKAYYYYGVGGISSWTDGLRQAETTDFAPAPISLELTAQSSPINPIVDLTWEAATCRSTAIESAVLLRKQGKASSDLDEVIPIDTIVINQWQVVYSDTISPEALTVSASYQLGVVYNTGDTAFSVWQNTDLLFNITYHNIGSLNSTSNPTVYDVNTPDITLAVPLDSNGYTFIGWYAEEEFEYELTQLNTLGLGGNRNIYAKWERDPFAAFAEYENPIDLSLSRTTDSLAFRVFIGNFANPDTSLSLLDMRLCYVDEENGSEVELAVAKLEEGAFESLVINNQVVDKGRSYANGNDFQTFNWGIDRAKIDITDNVDIRFYSKWEIKEGDSIRIDSTKHYPLLIDHEAFDVQETIYTTVPFTLNTEIEDEVSAWVWTFGQQVKTTQESEFTVSQSGSYLLNIVVTFDDNTTESFDFGQFVVNELPVLGLQDDFDSSAHNATNYTFDMDATGTIGKVSYLVNGDIPWGTYLDDSTGEFSWNETRTGLYDFSLIVKDDFDGYIRRDTVDYSLTIVPNTSIETSDNVNEGFPFEVDKISDYEADMWLWQLEGQEDVYSLYTQRYTVDTPGTYDFTLTPAEKNDAGTYSLLDAYKLETEIVVEPIADGYMQVSHDQINDQVSIESFTDFTAQFSTNMPSGFTTLSIEGLPEGATFNALSGMLRWTRVTSGSYNISVTATRVGTSETNTKDLELTVNPPTYSDITFNIKNQAGEAIENAMVVCGNDAVITDARGIATLSLMDLNSHELTISHDAYTSQTQSISVTDPLSIDVELKASVLILQNVKFTAEQITKDKSISTLTGDVAINDMLYFEGDNSVTIDLSADVMPLITTYNKLRYVGESSSRYLINNSSKKEFYLYQGLLIPKGNGYFDLGEVGSIPFEGHMMSFYADENEDGEVDDFGVEFAVFPRLPWVIGDFVSAAGYECRDLVMGLLRGANLDIEQIMAKAEEGSISYSPRDSTDEEIITNAAYQDSTMTGLFSKLRLISPSMPNIEVIKRYAYYGGESHSISLQEMEICYKAFGLENLGITYEYNKQTGRTAWGGSAYMKFGAKCKGYNSSSSREDDYITFDEMQDGLQESFDEFSDIDDVDIVMSDESGQVIYESSYGEFVDITDQVREGEYDVENRLFKGIGAEILIINGKLDKIYLSADVTVPLGPLTIQNLNGGVSGLTGEDDLTITFGATMTLTANKYVKFKDLQATVTPWSYYAFEGTLELYKSDLIYADMSYNSNRKQFYIGGSIIPEATKGVITGNVELGIGAKGIGGNAICNVKTPSDLPSPFGWAENRYVGSAAVGFSDRYIGAKVALGKKVTTYTKVKQRRGWWSSIKKKVKKAFTWVTKKITSFVSLELSIGYDFYQNKALFGKNVKIPKATRMVYRGDTLIQEFVVSDPIKMLYITSSCAIDSFVEFDVYNPQNALVGDEVVWCQDSAENEVLAVVMYPEIGTWRVKADTSGFSDVTIIAMYMDGAPQGMFESPVLRDTNSTEVMVRFNDVNDTLDVGIYLDNDKEGYNGSLIKDLKVLNKASLKFTYTPTLLNPGEYYFYYTVEDKSGVPEYKYADGSIVIEPSNDALPLGVKSEIVEDSLVFTWDVTDESLVDYVSIELTDLKTGEVILQEVWDTTYASFDSLSLAHSYAYSIRNKSEEIGVSEEISGEILIYSTLENNPPKWNMADGEYYELYENQVFHLTLDVEDIENLPLNIINVSANVPKSVTLTNGVLSWLPTSDECGVYEFMFAANDGELSDTVTLKLEVKAEEKADIEINFASTKLYEEDNMFLILSDAISTDSLKIAWLHNISKGDSILVNMTRSDEETYMGHFQLSYQRRSILPVSNGDTLLAEYFLEDDTAYAIAFFDSLPQLPDNVSPDAIADLEILSIGDYIAATFTVPEDRMDNGLLANPFYYDLRYAYRRLDSEEVYLSSFSIESYDVGVPGTRDTIYFEMDDLLDYDTSYRVWFNVKAGDPNYNMSEMSNVDSMDYIIAPSNLTASLQASQKGVDLEWDGVDKIEGDEFFEHYEVYRKYGAEDYELIAYSDITTFEDDFTNPVQDGVLTYAVRAIYQSNISDYVYSNQVDYDRYSNIRIKYYDERNVRSSGEMSYVILDPYYDVVATGVFNANGQSYEEDFVNGDYVLQIYSGPTMQITDDITVSSTSSYFEYVLEDGIVTSVVDLKSTAVLELFPNPAENELFVRVNNAVDNRNFEMYDVCGNKVQLSVVPREIGVDCSLYSVDVSSLSDGVYFIRVEGEESSNKTSQVVRFVKK